MSTDPVTSAPDSRSDQSSCASPGQQPQVNKSHADRTAKLFEDEYAKLVHYLVARTGSWAEAHDVASQAFAQVLEVQDPEAVSFLKGYVYRAARNIWADRVKIGANRRRIDQIAHYEFATTSPSPEPLLIQGQRAQVLQRAIDGLRPSRKMVLTWRIWDELTYREIASRLAEGGVVVDERTVSNWFADALEELGEAVRSLAGDFEGEVE